MRENLDFLSIKNKLNKQKEDREVKPITDNSKNEIDHKDYFLSLRQSIQELVDFERDDALEEERIKMLKELISQELTEKYQEILKLFRDKSSLDENHLEREFIDINEEELKDLIEEWILELRKEIENKLGSLNKEDLECLEAECWLFFDALSTSINTKSIERDIKEYIKKNRTDVQEEGDYKEAKDLLSNELQKRYPLDKSELNVLIDMIAKENLSEYNVKKLISTLSDIYDSYNLKDVKKKIGLTVAGYTVAEGIDAMAPYFLQDAGDADFMKNAKAVSSFFGSLSISRGMEAKINLVKLEILKHLDLEINKRLTNSLFFQEFEFIHEKSLGEIYSALERGKDSVTRIMDETVSSVIPVLFGSAASIGLLTKVNPLLGGIGLGSVPIMYHIARKQNKEISKIYEEEMKEQETATSAISAMKSGFEEIRTSSNIVNVAKETKGHFDVKDESTYKRLKKEVVMNYKRVIPFDISTFIAIGVGSLLQQRGLISPGALLTNVVYSSRLTQPVQQLVGIYYDKFPRHIQNIERMNEVLGKYEKLDLPEGEKEKERTSISELDNFDISIKNLNYKNILKDFNLEIKEGEFTTVAGPSGVGKSTLLRSLSGLFKPERGGVEIGGVKIEDIKKYGSESIFSILSYCNQSPQIFPKMTLRENLLLWSKGDTGDEEIVKILKDLHLDKFVNQLDENLKYASGGEKVRIGLARTLLKNPKIMLLDEPTASLDSGARLEVLKLIQEIRKKYPDRTIICVSHDDELIELGDKKINLSNENES